VGHWAGVDLRRTLNCFNVAPLSCGVLTSKVFPPACAPEASIALRSEAPADRDQNGRCNKKGCDEAKDITHSHRSAASSLGMRRRDLA